MTDTYTSWWQKPENIDQILTMAWELDAQYPDARIVAPGESFAWTVHTVGLKRRLEGREANVSHVPFSGEIYHSEPTAIVNYQYVDGDYLYETDVYERSIFNEVAPPSTTLDKSLGFIHVLSQTGNAPEDVVGRFEEKQQRTIFVDKAYKAEGLVSFAVLMDELAKRQGVQEEFQRAVHYHAYCIKLAFAPKSIQIENVGQFPGNISALLIRPDCEEEDRIHDISVDNKLGEDSSRMQARLDVRRDDITIEVPNNAGVQSEIRAALEAAVKHAVGTDVEGNGFVMRGTPAPPPEPNVVRKHVAYTPYS